MNYLDNKKNIMIVLFTSIMSIVYSLVNMTLTGKNKTSR